MPSLSHLEFDVVWEQLGIGEQPYPITVASHGETTEERAVLREKALHGLASRGLHDGQDLQPWLEDLLVMLVRNRFTVDGQISAGEHLRVIAAGGDERDGGERHRARQAGPARG